MNSLKISLKSAAAAATLINVLTFTPAHAATLDCEIIENGSVTSSIALETALSKKVSAGTTDRVIAYVTEKQDGSFMVEGFIAESEVRLFGQGSLRQSHDQVSASLWSRDYLIEISCKLIELDLDLAEKKEI